MISMQDVSNLGVPPSSGCALDGHHAAEARRRHGGSSGIGHIYYLPSSKSMDGIDLDQHLIGVSLTPGIVRTRLNSSRWQSNVIVRGSMFYIAAGSKIDVEKDEPTDLVLATVTREHADAVWRRLAPGNAPGPQVNNVVDDEIISLAEAIAIDVICGVDVSAAFERLIECAFGALCRGRTRRASRRYWLTDRQLKNALDFVGKNIDKKISVDDMARCAGDLSSSYFAHGFKDSLGCSPYQYIMMRRLSRAFDMIGTTDAPLAEVAYASGFSSQPHMTDIFRRRLAITPQLLRRHLSQRARIIGSRMKDRETPFEGFAVPGGQH